MFLRTKKPFGLSLIKVSTQSKTFDNDCASKTKKFDLEKSGRRLRYKTEDIRYNIYSEQSEQQYIATEIK
jgi:hypothetical protein